MTLCNQNLGPLKLLCDRLLIFLSQIWLSAIRQTAPTPLTPTPAGLLIILHPFTNHPKKRLFCPPAAESDQATNNFSPIYQPPGGISTGGENAGIITKVSPPAAVFSGPVGKLSRQVTLVYKGHLALGRPSSMLLRGCGIT